MAQESRRSGSARQGILMIAAVTMFLSLGGCNPKPPVDGRQDDSQGTGSAWHGGGSGGYGTGMATGSGTRPDSMTGTMRGGFGQTGAMHASST